MAYDSSKFLKHAEIEITPETEQLLEQASAVFAKHHKNEVWYSKCIFLSWYCSLGDCKFCFRSVHNAHAMQAKAHRRTMGSVLIEALFCRIFDWQMEFLTGGYGINTFKQLQETVSMVSKVYGGKIWLNLGALGKKHLEALSPYVEGVCGSIESATPSVHEYVCPNKPLASYDRMFEEADGFRKSAAVIVGLGDEREDIEHLFAYIKKHNLDRVIIYALKPVKGTPYEEGPSVDEFCWWLAQVRIRFPKIEIVAGTNLRRCEEVDYLLRAGANAVSKFPATKQFGTKKAHIVHDLLNSTGRQFTSNIITYKDIDWHAEIDTLEIPDDVKKEMHEKIDSYVDGLKNPKEMDKSLR